MAEQKKISWNPHTLLTQVYSVCEETPDGCWLWRYGVWADRGLVGEREYPRIMIGGKRAPVMHWVLEAMGQPRPEGMDPCHSCDRPPCCNPAHLRWDTHKANMQDMGSRSRSGAQQHPDRYKRGDEHWTRLDPEKSKNRRKPVNGNYASGDEHWTHRDPDKVAQSLRAPRPSIQGDNSWQRRNPDRVLKGSQVKNAVLSEDLVRQIRQRAQAGEQQKRIAASLGLSPVTVNKVVKRVSWKHVD